MRIWWAVWSSSSVMVLDRRCSTSVPFVWGHWTFLSFSFNDILTTASAIQGPFVTCLRKLDDQSPCEIFPETTWWRRCQECWLKFRFQISAVMRAYSSNEMHFRQYCRGLQLQHGFLGSQEHWHLPCCWVKPNDGEQGLHELHEFLCTSYLITLNIYSLEWSIRNLHPPGLAMHGVRVAGPPPAESLRTESVICVSCQCPLAGLPQMPLSCHLRIPAIWVALHVQNGHCGPFLKCL